MPDQVIDPAAAGLAPSQPTAQDPTVQEHIQKIAVLAEQVVDLMVAADCTIMDISLLTTSITTRFNPVFFNTSLKEMLVMEATLLEKSAASVPPSPAVEPAASVPDASPVV